MELGLGLWRLSAENATAVLTAVDVHVDVQKETSTTFSRSFFLYLGTYDAFLDPSRSVQCIWGVLSTVIDWLRTAYSFRFRVRFLSQSSGRAV